MNKFFYSKLAVNSIRKNSKVYLPYILTCICTIAMYYIMYSISINKGIDKIHCGDSLKIILGFGVYVIGIFSVIFLFYTNSFLIKNRKKEFGLFNILGMEKKHISKMLFLETLYIFGISLILGLLLGILLSKAIYLLLLKLLNFNAQMGFEVPLPAILYTTLLFGMIFVLMLLNTLRQVHVSKPIELLKGSSVGEKEPKTKWILTIIGLICLSIGYYISLSTKDPIASITQFFVAVVFVMVGTYLLFTAGSIALLKVLRKNKRYYYKPNHFISVSGMIYRMKQNAVGLANICILSTAVLVMLSTTVSMYIGLEDVLRARYERNIIISSENTSNEDINKINRIVDNEVSKSNIKINNVLSYKYMAFPSVQEGNSFSFKPSDNINPANTGTNFSLLNFITIDDYNKLENTNIKLKDNEVLLYMSNGDIPSNTIKLNNTQLNIKEKLDTLSIGNNSMANLVNSYYVITSNEEVIKNISLISDNKDQFKGLSYYYGFDSSNNSEDQILLTNNLNSEFKTMGINVVADGAEISRETFFSLYGGLFFLGIFLGLLFIMATVLIIYYKQISEGYDDKKRFEIMQKVGISKQEIKKSIKSQVLTVFFIPLVTAGIHIAFAFNVISKLLILLGLTNTTLFAWCTLGTILVFGVFYALVYSLTAKVYYKIVS